MRVTNGIPLGGHCSYRYHHEYCRNTEGFQAAASMLAINSSPNPAVPDGRAAPANDARVGVVMLLTDGVAPASATALQQIDLALSGWKRLVASLIPVTPIRRLLGGVG